MRCGEIMTRDVAVVGTGQSVADAAKLMREMGTGFIPVCQSDGTVVGTLTDRDLAVRVIAEGRPLETAVQDVMSSGVVSCRPEDDVRVAEELMGEEQVNRIVVLDGDGTLAGVVSLSDVAQVEEDERRLGRLTADILEREAQV